MSSTLITGATGQLGALVVKKLLESTDASLEVHLAVRDPSKVSSSIANDARIVVHKADYNNTASYAAALQDIDRVLLISSNELIADRFSQHKTVIDAAKNAGVKQLAYTSLLHAEHGMRLSADHIATENYIKQSGLTYTFLRNGWYIENLTGSYAAWIEHGAVTGGYGNGRISGATRADYAAAAAKVLTTAGHDNRVYELGGDIAFSGTDVAVAASERSGKSIAWNPVTPAEWSSILTSVGVPSVLADVLADADAHAAEGALEDTSGQLARLIGRPTTTLQQVLSEL